VVLPFALAAAVLVPLAPPASGELVAAAAATGRPPECRPLQGSAMSSAEGAIWNQARRPELRRYCHLVARAQARLDSDPAAAQVAAKEAAKLLPRRAAPLVVQAQAAFARGKAREALTAFDKALALDPRSVEQPRALHDLARTRLLLGRHADALASYRVLVPRAALMPSRAQRARVLLEAAHVAMTLATSSDAPRQLDEALAYLREAARDPHPSHRRMVTLSFALALDRAGRSEQAEALLAELPRAGGAALALTSGAEGPGARARRDNVHLPNADEQRALEALALERDDARRAADAWRRYLDSPGGRGPFGAAAEARLRKLSGRPAGRSGEPQRKKPRRRRGGG
jgi:tetratricopeptide (TPR) repeat protein